MTAYMIVQSVITDEEQYGSYRKAVVPLIEAFRGKQLRGGKVTLLEGHQDERRIALFEFPSIEAIYAFWNSPDYVPVKELRRSAATLECRGGHAVFPQGAGAAACREPTHDHGGQEPGLPPCRGGHEAGRRTLALFAAAAVQIPEQHRGTGPPPDQTGGTTRAWLGSMRTARRTLVGYEMMAMIRKGQVHDIAGRDMPAQTAFIAELFEDAA